MIPNTRRTERQTSIPYSIVGCSGHSGKYIPENIKVNRPKDAASRWSGTKEGATGEQWIMLELKSVAVLESITFGKFSKTHPCNMKEFKLLTGMTKETMKEVLTSTLRNDDLPETIAVPHTTKGGLVMPTRYVKIISLSAYGLNFNTSIWYVALSGSVDNTQVERVQDIYDSRRQGIAMRHILKYLRQHRFISVYRQLLIQSGDHLEHPLVTDLYEQFVLRGDWTASESILHSIASSGLFSQFIQACEPKASWRRIHAVDENGDAPKARGGHAMCMDVENGLIYLFGGFDGVKSLDDFWVFDVRTERWKLICPNVGAERNGPGPRSCHKMVFDSRSGCIYLLGRLGDGDIPDARSTPASSQETNSSGSTQETSSNTTESRSRRSIGVNTVAVDSEASVVSTHQLSEFHRYRTTGVDQGKWEILDWDTSSPGVGGPSLIFDHQLVIDSDLQTIFVQGGRIIEGDWDVVKYSGLYSYDIRKGKWSLLQAAEDANARFGHSTLLDPLERKLFVFAGQYQTRYLSDMWQYDYHKGISSEVTGSFTAQGGPEGRFALRSVIDPNLKEIYAFDGLTKDRAGSSAESAVWMYRYGSQPGSWTKITSENSTPSSLLLGRGIPEEGAEINDREGPKARAAHQVVYDPLSQTFYMHGGNAGSSGAPPSQDSVDGSLPKVDKDVRLDDFWKMTLKRPPPSEIIRKATFEVRKQQFKEMCEDEEESLKALNFLQTELHAVVDHSNIEEADTFRSLLSHLLAPRPGNASRPPSREVENGNGDEMLVDDVYPTAEDRFRDTEEKRNQIKDGPEVIALRDGRDLSDETFAQRSAVFETLITFVNDSMKQPKKNLLDVLGDDEL